MDDGIHGPFHDETGEPDRHRGQQRAVDHQLLGGFPNLADFIRRLGRDDEITVIHPVDVHRQPRHHAWLPDQPLKPRWHVAAIHFRALSRFRRSTSAREHDFDVAQILETVDQCSKPGRGIAHAFEAVDRGPAFRIVVAMIAPSAAATTSVMARLSRS